MAQNKKKIECVKILWGILFIQFMTIVWFNFSKSENFLDYDSSLALRHGLEMWKNGIALEGWNYFSTLEIDNAAFWAIPLYMATDNLNIALGTVHIVLYCICAYAIYDILKNIRAPKAAFPLTMLAIFTPYSVGQLEWANMIFLSVGQYEFRILTMLYLIDLVIISTSRTKKFWIILGVYLLLNFWTSLSVGNYVLLMIIFPVVLVWIWSIAKKAQLVHVKRSLLVIISSVIISSIGWGMHSYIVGGESGRSNLPLITAKEFWSNIGDCITGIFLLFDALPVTENIMIFSAKGIYYLFHFAFLVLCLGLITSAYIQKSGTSMLSLFLGAFILVNFGVFFLTDTKYGSPIFEYRYHILWGVLMMMLVVQTAVRAVNYKEDSLLRYILWMFIVGVIGTNILGFYKIIWHYNSEIQSYESAILDIAEKKDVESIYLYQDVRGTSHLIRMMNPDLYCISLAEKDGHLIAETGNFYQYYGDNSIAESSNVLIVSQENFDKFPTYIKNKYSFVLEVGQGNNAYYASENPWDAMTGAPIEGLSQTIDFPYTEGFKYKGTIDERGVLVSGTAEENTFILVGPNMQCEAGNYDVTLHYKVLGETRSTNRFEAGGLSETQTIDMPYGNNKITISNIQLLAGDSLQVRVWKGEGGILELYKIEYERVG